MSGTRVAQFATSLSHDSAAIEAASAYTTVGTWPSKDIDVVTFVNTSDVDVRVSFDGTNDHILIPSGVIRSINFRDIDMICSSTETPKFKKKSGTASSGEFEIEFIFA